MKDKEFPKKIADNVYLYSAESNSLSSKEFS
jgi:hypothetical protein